MDRPKFGPVWGSVNDTEVIEEAFIYIHAPHFAESQINQHVKRPKPDDNNSLAQFIQS